MADLAGNNSTTTSILAGDEFVGSFENLGDTDWIRIELVAGLTYSLNLGAATSTSGSYFDTVLEVYDASSSLVARNDDTGFAALGNPTIGAGFSGASYLQFTPTTSGTYYLAASSFDGGYIGEYLLSAHQEDVPDTAATPAQLQLGASMVGQITTVAGGDRDAYTIETVPGQYYTVVFGGSLSLDGSGSANPYLLAPDLVAIDASGAAISVHFNFLGEITNQLTFQATSTTTILSVGTALSGDEGQYILRVNEGSPLDALEWNMVPQPSHLNVYFVDEAEVTPFPGSPVFFGTDWTADEIASAMAAFDAYAQVANLTFSFVDDPAEADFFMVRAPLSDGIAGQAYPFFRTSTASIDGIDYTIESLAIFDPTEPSWVQGQQPGSSAFFTLLHEIGHMLGLAHPFDTNGGSSALPGILSPIGYHALDFGDFSLNQNAFTVMSYVPGFWEKDGAFSVAPFGNAGSPMALDIGAVQSLYGANTTTNAGNDTYVLPNTNDIGTFYQAIWDAGGIDTIAAAPINTAGATIDLRAASLRFDSLGGGAVSSVNGVSGGFTIAAGVVIENATGASGNDRLIGNEAANVLLGNGGADRLAGGAGDDELRGGDGDDVLFGDTMPGEPTGIGMGDGQVVKSAGAGNSWFDTAIDLTGEFSLAADPDIANATVTPHVTVSGTGDGNFDFYALTVAAGTTITLDIDYTTGGLDSFVEIYQFDGSSFTFYGAQDDNLIAGGAGGSSTITDSFGTFTVRTSGTYYIVVEDVLNFFVGAGQNYELNISVSATTEAVGSGAGNDLLDGGIGADTMSGGGGNDRYIIDNAGDVAIEIAGGGDADEVHASVTYSAVGQHIERIVLTGNAAINATGQELDNVITGNAQANRLDGADGNDWLDGGAGADFLIGGKGDDVFIVDHAHDRVIEVLNGGYDEIRSAVSFDLGVVFQNIEALSLTGTANINGGGNRLDNVIVGNVGANRIDGGLGADRLDGKGGADFLTGGLGSDTFVFSSTLGAGNVDTIRDFRSYQDWIELDNAIFTGLADGDLYAAAFKDLGRRGATVDSSDRILFNSDTGDLFFDADGSGHGFAAIKFANIGKHASLSAADFIIV